MANEFSKLLKTCPFCGESEIVPATTDKQMLYHCVTCETCGPTGADWESATLQWNTRARVLKMVSDTPSEIH